MDKATRREYGITSSAGFCSSTEVVLVGRGAGAGTGPIERVLWMAGCSHLVDSIILLDFLIGGASTAVVSSIILSELIL